MYRKRADIPKELSSMRTEQGTLVDLTIAQANLLSDMVESVKADIPEDKEADDKAVLETAQNMFLERHTLGSGRWVEKEETLLNEDDPEEMPEEPKNEYLGNVMNGSFEDLQRKLTAAIKDNGNFKTSNDDYVCLEATFKNKIIVRADSYSNTVGPSQPRYFQANYKVDGDNVTLSDIIEVKPDIKLKPVNEDNEDEETIDDGVKYFNEGFITNILLEEVQIGDKTVKKGRVPIAQRGDVLNKNKRIYPGRVLETAVRDAKELIKQFGGLPMDSLHRVREGKNFRDLRETVAVIKDLNYDPNDKIVSLDDIRFVNTQAGKDIVSVIEDGGLKLQVSQRGAGTSEQVKGSDSKLVEMVSSLKLSGFDFVPPGDASVDGADFFMETLTEGAINEMNEKKVLSEDEVKGLIEEGNNSVITAMTDTLKEAGVLKDKNEEIEEPDPQDDPINETNDDSPVEDKEPKEEPKKDDQSGILIKQMGDMKKKVDDTETQLLEIRKKDELVLLHNLSESFMSEELAKDDYARFSDGQKKTLIETVDVESVYGTVDLSKPEEVQESIKKLLTEEMVILDKYLADAKLTATGFGQQQSADAPDAGKGITHVEVINESVPNAEYIHKLSDMVEDRLALTDKWLMPKDHVMMPKLKTMLESFDEEHGKKLLLEANEDIKQLDIGVRVASISRVIIPAAFRRLTALQVCDVGTMSNRIDDIPVQAWVPAETAVRIDTDMAAIEIAETDTIATAGVTYTNFPLYAIRKALRTQISSSARATAKGTSMNPEADAVAGLVQDIQRRLDRLLWRLMITGAQMQATTEVTTFEECVRVGSTNEHQSANRGWLKFEWTKTVDANSNPTGAYLNPLFGTVADNTLQEVVAREGGGDNTALVYEDDYSINYSDGSVLLTTAGATKCAADLVEVKYTYTTNAKFWSVVPDSGVTLYDHLINLRQSVGQSRVLVANRHYNPNFLGMSLEMEDLVTSGPQFTESGRTPADVLGRLNEVMTYAGLEPNRSSAIPQQWVIIGEKGSAVYRVQTPWNLRGPITSETTGDDFYLAEEFSGEDVPVKDKIALVGITDLAITQ